MRVCMQGVEVVDREGEEETRPDKGRGGGEYVPVDTDFDRHVEVLVGGGVEECVGDEEKKKKRKRSVQRWNWIHVIWILFIGWVTAFDPTSLLSLQESISSGTPFVQSHHLKEPLPAASLGRQKETHSHPHTDGQTNIQERMSLTQLGPRHECKLTCLLHPALPISPLLSICLGLDISLSCPCFIILFPRSSFLEFLFF